VLKALSVDELRQKVTALRPSAARPELPEQYNRRSLLSLPTAELRTLVKRYGSARVDEAFARV
jgi:hypothetical protein